MEKASRGPFQDRADLRDAVDGLPCVDQIPEQEEEHDDEDQFRKGEADVPFNVEEREVVILVENAGQVEDAGGQIEADGQGKDQGDGQERLLAEGMGPGYGDQVLVGVAG